MITDGVVAGVIDTLDVTVMPEAIGGGIPLFAGPYAGQMDLIESTVFSNGAVRLIYQTVYEGIR
ncbi:MAG: hypothetical protein MUQ27_07235 [Acidimicrobiia bacterium]|nr:hypothetical protein [Acidimicrobiia bacterium]